MQHDLAAWKQWHLGAPIHFRAPAMGTVNRTLLIECDAGSFALRISQRGRARVQWEHSAIRFAADNGIPVCVPISLRNGDTIVECGEMHYSLFPTATGSQVTRSDLQIPHAESAGACLARIHRAFQSFPNDMARRKNLHGDVDVALARIPSIKAAIRARNEASAVEEWALTQLDGRRQWLENHGHLAQQVPALLASLPQTVLHGDFQETNLFFGENCDVSAVIDWDQSGLAARGWDVVRAIDLMFALEPSRSKAFVDAYRQVLALPAAEMDDAAFCYGVMAAANLWVYESTYIQRDERARQFILPQEFTSFNQRWSRAALND